MFVVRTSSSQKSGRDALLSTHKLFGGAKKINVYMTLCVVFAILNAACTHRITKQPAKAYFDPDFLPSTIQARLIGPKDNIGEFLITCVNGDSMYRWYPKYDNGRRHPNDLWIHTGKNYFLAEYTTQDEAKKAVHMWVNAEQGHTYVLKKKLEGYSINIWLEDATLGSKVGSVVGPEHQEDELYYCVNP